MHEQLPLTTIHDAVLEFLRGRDDVALFGAQAVNAYVSEPRMSQDVDLISTRAAELAEELRVRNLSSAFFMRLPSFCFQQVSLKYRIEATTFLGTQREVGKVDKDSNIESMLSLDDEETALGPNSSRCKSAK